MTEAREHKRNHAMAAAKGMTKPKAALDPSGTSRYIRDHGNLFVAQVPARGVR